ncbi:MAG TPA: hypothetical protein VHR45_13585 [Thermoanaerobaculia bacterium]|nr:hypothetical protein [Thermoanaerobaculia bacterium]
MLIAALLAMPMRPGKPIAAQTAVGNAEPGAIPAAGGAVPAPRVRRITIRSIDGIITVQTPGGKASMFRAGAHQPAAGSTILVRHQRSKG